MVLTKGVFGEEFSTGERCPRLGDLDESYERRTEGVHARVDPADKPSAIVSSSRPQRPAPSRLRRSSQLLQAPVDSFTLQPTPLRNSLLGSASRHPRPLNPTGKVSST